MLLQWLAPVLLRLLPGVWCCWGPRPLLLLLYLLLWLLLWLLVTPLLPGLPCLLSICLAALTTTSCLLLLLLQPQLLLVVVLPLQVQEVLPQCLAHLRGQGVMLPTTPRRLTPTIQQQLPAGCHTPGVVAEPAARPLGTAA